VAVNGCCYGRDDSPDKGDYLKLCGQRFWEFISGDEHLYTEIIDPLGHKAKEKNEKFFIEYTKVINRFTLEFSKEYCSRDGAILWNKLVQLINRLIIILTFGQAVLWRDKERGGRRVVPCNRRATRS
jgi:hypothetical protein